MKTLLNFTPRLIAIVLLVFFCLSLVANGTGSTVVVPEQTAGKVVIEFILLSLAILLPMMIRKKRKKLL